MKTRKIFALALAVMMLLVLAANTFAADTYTITINNTVDGYTYEAYQIFTGKLEGGTLSDIQWGKNISEAGKTALGDAAKYAEGTLEGKTSGMEEIADTLAGYITGTAAASTSTLETKTVNEVETKYYELTGLAAGYYLVKNSEVPSGADATDAAYTDYILKIVADTSVNPKSSVPSVEKKIVEDENKVDVNEASIGDVVKYEIVGTMPSTISTYDKYYYEFKDTLSSGLTFNDDIKVMIGTTDVTAYFYKNET